MDLHRMNLPTEPATPLIRTDFSNDETWQRIVRAATQASPDGFTANLTVVDDRAFEDAEIEQLAALAESTTEHALLIVADAKTMSNPELPLLCIDPLPPGGAFRVVPEHLWGVENNVSIVNMDFSEFASAVDPDGVFRGFRD